MTRRGFYFCNTFLTPASIPTPKTSPLSPYIVPFHPSFIKQTVKHTRPSHLTDPSRTHHRHHKRCTCSNPRNQAPTPPQTRMPSRPTPSAPHPRLLVSIPRRGQSLTKTTMNPFERYGASASREGLGWGWGAGGQVGYEGDWGGGKVGYKTDRG